MDLEAILFFHFRNRGFDFWSRDDVGSIGWYVCIRGFTLHSGCIRSGEFAGTRVLGRLGMDDWRSFYRFDWVDGLSEASKLFRANSIDAGKRVGDDGLYGNRFTEDCGIYAGNSD